MRTFSRRTGALAIVVTLGGACAAFGLPSAFAARVGAPPPSASAVQAAAAQPAAQQADESASLRQGLVTALAPNGDKLQVHGIWLGVADGKTQLLRGGRPAKLETLKVGETIRFMLAPGSAEPPMVRVIYAQ